LNVNAQSETVANNIVARPFPSITVNENGITAERYFDSIKQGRIGLVRITGETLTGVRGIFYAQEFDFFEMADGWYGIIIAHMDIAPRTYDLSILTQSENGENTSLTMPIPVELGGFIRQEFDVPPERAYLIEPTVERDEFAKLESIVSTYTAERLWSDEGFQLPIQSDITSPFGAFRIMNQRVETRHTGWDLQAITGTPVMAMADGRVAFAGQLDIRGNYVMIDHGYGIYSGYAHFSQVHVTRGQTVKKGQIIGVTGNTGRSSGPHLHWEIAVNGLWVDSVDFMNVWLP
jgi:hypothetical protein